MICVLHSEHIKSILLELGSLSSINVSGEAESADENIGERERGRGRDASFLDFGFFTRYLPFGSGLSGLVSPVLSVLVNGC